MINASIVKAEHILDSCTISRNSNDGISKTQNKEQLPKQRNTQSSTVQQSYTTRAAAKTEHKEKAACDNDLPQRAQSRISEIEDISANEILGFETVFQSFTWYKVNGLKMLSLVLQPVMHSLMENLTPIKSK